MISLYYQSVKSNVPWTSLQVCIKSMVDNGFLIPRQARQFGRSGTWASGQCPDTKSTDTSKKNTSWQWNNFFFTWLLMHGSKLNAWTLPNWVSCGLLQTFCLTTYYFYNIFIFHRLENLSVMLKVVSLFFYLACSALENHAGLARIQSQVELFFHCPSFANVALANQPISFQTELLFSFILKFEVFLPLLNFCS